jgi:hypothetical protein
LRAVKAADKSALYRCSVSTSAAELKTNGAFSVWIDGVIQDSWKVCMFNVCNIESLYLAIVY